jgi:putative glutamine amidotransferase
MSKRVAVTFSAANPAKVEPYEAALRAVGLEPVRNPESLTGVEGLHLTGGTDVDPKLYGEPRHPETQEPDCPRDELEFRLLREAFDARKPVFAICRGMQVLNVACGGTLIQHLDDSGKHRVRIFGPSADVHNVKVLPQTKLAVIAGEGEHPANSRHHQAVGRLGEGLVVSAVSADDGVIEGIERPDHPFAVAVQWHPEDRIACDAKDRRLFEAFARALKGKD